jgi:hypothetical protein
MKLARRLMDRFARRAPYALMAVAALTPLSWFSRGLPIKGVDSYFSLHPIGRFDTSLSAWDSRTSTGGATSDLITLGINGAQAGLAQIGLSLVAIQSIFLVLIAVAAVLGMYRLVMHVLRPRVTETTARWIAACLCVVWLANPFALSFVWFHQLLIEFSWAALPWLLFVVLAAVENGWSLLTMAAGIVLVLVVGSAGFPHVYLPAVALLLLIFGIAAVAFSGDPGRRSLRLSVAALAFAVGVVWWLVPTLPVLQALVAESTTGQESARAQLVYGSQFSSVWNVLSLTGVPTLYQTASGTPYVSWALLIVNSPGNALRFVLPVLALIGAVYGIRVARARRVAIPAAICLGIGVFFSKGASQPFPGVNLGLTGLPFGDMFRHPLDKFSFIVVLPMCMLSALGLELLARHRTTRPIGVFSALVVCGFLAVPWWTGGVIPVGGGLLPSAYVDVPGSYDAIGRALALSPPSGKTMVLPYSQSGGAAFKWRSGIQPNLDCLLQDWAPQRSLLCEGSGQLLADRVPQTLTQAVLNSDPRTLDLANLWGVDRWLVHNDWDSAYMPLDPTPASALAFLNNPTDLPPAKPITRQNQTVALAPAVTLLSFYFRTPKIPINEDRLLEIGPLDIQINATDSPTPSVFVALRDQSRNLWDPGSAVSVDHWHAVTIEFRDGEALFSVDGMGQGAPNTCPGGSGTCTQPTYGGISLDKLPASIRVDSSSQTVDRTTSITVPSPGRAAVGPFLGAPGESLLATTNELTLFGQASQPVIYAARSIFVRKSLDTPEEMLQAAHDVVNSPAPLLVTTMTAPVQTDSASITSWTRDSSTHYHGSLISRGSSVLVFLQTYDPHWTLVVNNQTVAASRHFTANGFANAWAITGAGNLDWRLEYDLQQLSTIGAGFGGVLLVVALGVTIWQGTRRRVSS